MVSVAGGTFQWSLFKMQYIAILHYCPESMYSTYLYCKLEASDLLKVSLKCLKMSFDVDAGISLASDCSGCSSSLASLDLVYCTVGSLSNSAPRSLFLSFSNFLLHLAHSWYHCHHSLIHLHSIQPVLQPTWHILLGAFSTFYFSIILLVTLNWHLQFKVCSN